MDARLVTVAREISSLNANIIRSRLEAEGIQCFVSGEAVSSVVGLPANVGAFIDVHVLDFDAARAQSILQEIAEAPRNRVEDDFMDDHEQAEDDHANTISYVTCFAIIFFSSATFIFVAAKDLLGGLLANVVAISLAVFLGVLLTSIFHNFTNQDDYDN